jgi:hypothetical protein
MSFKNDNGMWLTKALFLELTLPATRQWAKFTLKEHDHTHDGVPYKSLYRLYMETDDPTEYEFATKHLGGWSHWKAMLDTVALREHIDSWREEKEIYYRSKGIKSIMESAAEGNYQASKYLADKGWTQDSENKRGRPSKAEVKKETEQQVKVKLAVMNDYKRLKDK